MISRYRKHQQVTIGRFKRIFFQTEHPVHKRSNFPKKSQRQTLDIYYYSYETQRIQMFDI